MELLCPECLGTLESRDGLSARCTAHGGEFQILFARHPITVSSPAPPASPPEIVFTTPPNLSENAVCANHQYVAAAFVCSTCGTPICGVCDFQQPDGTHRCPACAQRRAVAPPLLAAPVQSFPEGVRCVQHPNVKATGQCKVCGGFMCSTCAFDLPGGIKVCPTCAANPKTSLSPKRQKMLIGSFALAVWCTVVMGAMFAGIFKGMANDEAGQQALGILLMIILLGPAITGFSLGIGCMDRRLPGNMAIWFATIWNGLILGGFILLMIVGLMMK